MQTDAVNFTEQDARAVHAVRRGDTERYRELVERHERRVYAVAWSRLGDAALAEEVTQEAFIRAYRRLWLLGDAAKFSGWIASIARHVAINFGLRHRRELSKRERWALEQAQAADSSDDKTDAPCTPETLRHTLAELPAAHRECLVLFYLEGRSGVEAAATLGISEAALRVRLHRARAALRERLEQRLADSLGKLGPGRTLVPAIMAGVLASSSAKAAIAGGAGVSVVGTLVKFAPLQWLLPFFGLIACLPGLVLSAWLAKVERRNYRDRDGFRARLHRDFFRSFLWGFPVLLILIWLGIGALRSGAGLNRMHLGLAILMWALVAIQWRSLTINCNRFQVGMLIYCLILAGGTGLTAAGLVPVVSFPIFFIAATLWMIPTMRWKPTRMDYSLFLRAAKGMLEVPDVDTEATNTARRLAKAELLHFTRFLGERWLVNNFRWTAEGFMLRLPGVKTSFLANMAGIFPFFTRRASHLTLHWDGSVNAHCSNTDTRALRDLADAQAAPRDELEQYIAKVVETAWRAFRDGKTNVAITALGETPEADVFVVPPHQSRAARVWRWALIGCVVLMLPSVVIQFVLPTRMSGLKPVSLTETDVRAAMAELARPPERKGSLNNGLSFFLWSAFVLPPTNFFTADALIAIRRQIFQSVGFSPNLAVEHRARQVNSPRLTKPILGGWIGWDDVRVTPERAAEALRDPKTGSAKLTLALRQCEVDGRSFTVTPVDAGVLTQLRWLHHLNCLDLVNREQFITNICSSQVLSGDVSPGRPSIAGWRSVRGLFVTPNWPALQDTYCAVAALEILGGLDRMDREACIERILKLHRGKGFFAPPQADNASQVQIRGDAHDTFTAFETLRILGALDRVRDLEKWQFRARKGTPASATQPLAWEQIEAWVCQQRFERFLREQQENSTSQARPPQSRKQRPQFRPATLSAPPSS